MSGAPVVVAIDGPSGVGKSTAARSLAKALGVPYLDTGAMYRCLGLVALREGVDLEDREIVEEALASAELEVEVGPDGALILLLNGSAAGDEIRTPEVSMATSKVSRYPGVRRRLVELQRRFARLHGGVIEGRDIGSVVVPETPHKFFLDADPGVRARRRYDEFRTSSSGPTLEEVRADLERRDRQDCEREDSPLQRVAGQIEIDTGALTPRQVVDEMLRVVVSDSAPPGGLVG